MIWGSFILILAGAPLLMGSVHALIYGGIQVLSLFIFFLYGVRQVLIPSALSGSSPYRFRSFLLRHPFVIPFLFWLVLGGIQMIPLWPWLLGILSPKTLEIDSSILGILGAHPLSLSPFDTWQALIQGITCATLFYLTAIYFPSDQLQSGTNDRFLRSLLWVMTLTVLFESFYGLTEYLMGNDRIYFFPRPLRRGAAGTFINPNHFANYLGFLFPTLFSWSVLLMEDSNQRGERGRARGMSLFQGILLGVILTVAAMAVASSHSRMGIFSWALGMILLGLALLFRSSRIRPMILLLAIVLTAILFLFFWDPGLSTFQEKLSRFFSPAEIDRLRVLRDSFEMVRDFPWFGTGLGTFSWIFPKYSSVPITVRFTHVHNDWLELLVETGGVGFLLIGVTGGWFFVASLARLPFLQPRTRFLTIGILISLFVFMIHSLAEFNFHIPANAYSFAILAGMAVRLTDQGEK